MATDWLTGRPITAVDRALRKHAVYMRHAAVIIVHRRLSRRRGVPRDQSQPISAIDWLSSLATSRAAGAAQQNRQHPLHSFIHLICEFLRTTSGFPCIAMTSQNVGGVCESTKRGCSLELQLFDEKNCSDNYHVQRPDYLTVPHRDFTRRSVDFAVDPVARRSTSFSCTPHSIEDILSRPRRVHVTSVLLPESRRTSDLAAQARLYSSWSTRASGEVQERLAQRSGDDDLTWKSVYWSQRSPVSHERLAGTTPMKRGKIKMLTMMIVITRRHSESSNPTLPITLTTFDFSTPNPCH